MEEVIPSPFSQKRVAYLKIVPDTMEFRGKTYHFLNHYYIDECGEEFTDEATGELNFSQVYNQYRKENNIPSADEIARLREDCRLSRADMGRILGFGENQYYRYELGEVPSPSNGRLLRTLIDNREALNAATVKAIEDVRDGKADKASSVDDLTN